MCGECLRTRFFRWAATPGSPPHCSQLEFGLPAQPPRPRAVSGVPCAATSVSWGENEPSYCGLRTVRQGKLTHLAGTPERGLLQWYRDPLPTNCVADWVCEGSRHRGCHNLAVFYASCTANCLFCQNWHWREMSPVRDRTISARQLAAAANSRTFCVCYFGGDPASQMPHALATSRYLRSAGCACAGRRTA